MVKEFDIERVFDDTIKNLRDEILTANARVALIQEFKQFFATNNLKVYQEVSDTPAEDITKGAVEAVTETEGKKPATKAAVK